jgi:hypothetical protein
MNAVRAHGHVRRLLGGRAHQGDGAAMANELGNLGVIAEPQAEHVVFAADHDGLPPTQGQGLLGDHQMASRDFIPGPGQAAGRRHGLWLGRCDFLRQSNHDFAVELLPDVGHEATAVAVKPTDRQLLRDRGQIFGGHLANFEVHKLGRLATKSGSASVNRAAHGLWCSSYPYRAGPGKAWLKTKKPRGAGPIAFPGSGVTMPRDAQKAFLEHEDVMELLRLEIARAGSQGRWAEKMGIDRPQLNKMPHGCQVLSTRVIKALKLRVVFTRAAASLKHPAKRKRA